MLALVLGFALMFLAVVLAALGLITLEAFRDMLSSSGLVTGLGLGGLGVAVATPAVKAAVAKAKQRCSPHPLETPTSTCRK
jgi:hypothetical protein